MEVLQTHGLRGIFFVECLFAEAVGLAPLADVVQHIRRRGHDVQPHTHTEWLAWLDRSPLPGRTGKNMHNFTLAEQEVLLARTLSNLRAAGVVDIRAFRAGNFGANLDTLRALARLGISCDFSYNFCMPRCCGLPMTEPLLQPCTFDLGGGVREYPLSYFSDWPGHYRHAQLAACSFREMTAALLAAWKSDWQSFVILSHSFELIRNRKGPNPVARPNPTVITRLERLCRFLASNNDRFQTVTTAELTGDLPEHRPKPRPLRGSLLATLLRFAEQIAMRVG
jgi:hypothetical protein